MADATATFGIDLAVDGKNEAEGAAQALALLRKRFDDDTSSLRQMNAAMKILQSGTTVSIDTFKKLQKQMDEKRASLIGAQEELIRLGGAFTKSKKPPKELGDAAAKAGDGLKTMLDSAKAGAGPLGGLFEKANSLKNAIGAGGLTAVAIAAAAGFAVLVAAAVAGATSLTHFAFASADASRAQLLLDQGLTGSKASAAAYQETIDEVSRGVAISSDKVAGYAKDLYLAGLRGNVLKSALEAASIKAAVLGDTAAGAFVDAAKGAKAAGASVVKLSDDVKSKLGGVAAAQMLSLSVQTAKLEENLGKLFKNVGVEKFEQALQSILSVFDETTSSGHALKVLSETIFAPLFDSVSGLGPIVKAMFQGMIVGALIVTIGVLKVRNAFRDAFGKDALGGLDLADLTMKAVAVTVIALGIAVGIALLPIFMLVTAGKQLKNTFDEFSLAAKAAWAFMSNLNFTQVGLDLVTGFVNGIKQGAQAVIDAVKGLGSSALAALRGALDSHSPSRAFAKLGLTAPQGMAEGVDAGVPDVEASVASMVSVPTEVSPRAGR